MPLKLCPKEEWYDYFNDKVIPYLVAITVIYLITFCYLIIRFAFAYIERRTIRIKFYVITFQITIALGLVIRTLYFPGVIVPFCYGKVLYLILAEYPSLFQSIAISTLTIIFSETLKGLPIESSMMYSRFKKVIIGFVIVYPIIFISVHTLSLIDYNNSSRRRKYVVFIAGQVFVLVSFTIISHKLTDILKKIYSELSSNSLRFLLILISFLLFTRVVLGFVNILDTMESLKEGEHFFFYTLISLLGFEIALTLALVALSSLQDNQKNKMLEPKGDISEIIEESRQERNTNENE